MCVLSIADESEVGKSIFTYSPNTSTQIFINCKEKIRKFMVENPSRHHLTQKINVIICNLTNKYHVQQETIHKKSTSLM